MTAGDQVARLQRQLDDVILAAIHSTLSASLNNNR